MTSPGMNLLRDPSTIETVANEIRERNMTSPDMSLLREAREISKAALPSKARDHLRAWTDAFEQAWKDVCVRPTRASLRHLNACTIKVCQAIDAMPPMPEPPASQGGRVDSARLAA